MDEIATVSVTQYEFEFVLMRIKYCVPFPVTQRSRYRHFQSRKPHRGAPLGNLCVCCIAGAAPYVARKFKEQDPAPKRIPLGAGGGNTEALSRFGVSVIAKHTIGCYPSLTMKEGEQFIWLLKNYVRKSPFQRTEYLSLSGSPTEEQTEHQFQLMLKVGIVKELREGFRVTDKGRRVLEEIDIRRSISRGKIYWPRSGR